MGKKARQAGKKRQDDFRDPAFAQKQELARLFLEQVIKERQKERIREVMEGKPGDPQLTGVYQQQGG